MESCCNLVGNFNAAGEDIISINVRSSTEVSKLDGKIIIGPTVGSIGLTKYASTEVYVGCPGRAGVQIPWVRRYDCENDLVYFIFAGAGRSYISGSTNGNVSIINEAIKYGVIQASASSGPTSLYQASDQTDGYGLKYTDMNSDWSFETKDAGSCTFTNFGIGTGPLYMQSFSIDFVPGQVPIATYDLVFTTADVIEEE